LPFGKEKKRKRWLTRTSTFRKGKKRERWVDQEVNIAEGEKACEVVDEDVNLPERKKSEGQISNLCYSGNKLGVSEIYSKVFSKMVLDRKPSCAKL